ncbi:hypothetical protein TSAR_014357 [Trichomalopsis sarcophagae]|uniref:Uncharacterized protein n=1 Tax=Trichomalopsis sarcophagae TaxID=543379 RepID=A0A232EL47_9HYME|nr:hypothetical protein TSAR_014357 [Trichomalopsis sarcophagae]
MKQNVTPPVKNDTPSIVMTPHSSSDEYKWAVCHNFNQLSFGSYWSMTNNGSFKMSSETNIPSTSTSPVSDLAKNFKKNMHIKSCSPTQKRRKIKRRLNQICDQISKIKLSPPPQQQNIDKNSLDSFSEATTVKKGSKRALEQPETLAPPIRNCFIILRKSISRSIVNN